MRRWTKKNKKLRFVKNKNQFTEIYWFMMNNQSKVINHIWIKSSVYFVSANIESSRSWYFFIPKVQHRAPNQNSQWKICFWMPGRGLAPCMFHFAPILVHRFLKANSYLCVIISLIGNFCPRSDPIRAQNRNGAEPSIANRDGFYIQSGFARKQTSSSSSVSGGALYCDAQ